jgi:hypothetical protein
MNSDSPVRVDMQQQQTTNFFNIKKRMKKRFFQHFANLSLFHQKTHVRRKE